MKFSLKKSIALGITGAFLLTACPVIISADPVVQIAFAAKGGAKFSPKASAPKTPAKPAPSAGSTQKADKPNNQDYQPSKSAKDLQKDAPGAKSQAAGTTANANTGSRFGNALRNIGLLAGGMMLGGMLASLFGMGGGFLSDIMGILMNVLLFGAAFMVIRWLWNKFRNRGNSQENVYRQSYAANRQPEPMSQSRQPVPPVMDIRPPAGDYDPKTTADRYRNR